LKSNLFYSGLTLLTIQVISFIGISILVCRFELLYGLLFEQILLSAFISGSITAITIWVFRQRNIFNLSASHWINHSFIAVITTLVIFISASNTLLNIDRSRSFYVLNWVGQGEVANSPNGLDLTRVHSGEKMSSVAIEKRIEEQVARGLIKRTGGNFLLTNRGKLTLWVANFISHVYSLQGWKQNNY
jgi:hypothetical protein